MKIGGWQKISLIDYPGKISTIVFTQGCNFRCPFCHNPELVLKEKYSPLIEEDLIFAFLEKRKGEVEGVEVTGGEPTLQGDLDIFLEKVKKLGYLVKLDTNGSKPEVLEKLFEKNLVDYLAVDIKGPFEKYEEIIGGVKVDLNKIKESIRLIKDSGVDYEFRTTFVRPLLVVDDFEKIGEVIKGAKRFVVQNFTPHHYGAGFTGRKFVKEDNNFFPASQKELEESQKIVKKYVQEVLLRD